MSIFGDKRVRVFFVGVLIAAFFAVIMLGGNSKCANLTDRELEESLEKRSFETAAYSSNSKILGRYEKNQELRAVISYRELRADNDLVAKLDVYGKSSKNILYSAHFFKNCEVQWLID